MTIKAKDKTDTAWFELRLPAQTLTHLQIAREAFLKRLKVTPSDAYLWGVTFWRTNQSNHFVFSRRSDDYPRVKSQLDVFEVEVQVDSKGKVIKISESAVK